MATTFSLRQGRIVMSSKIMKAQSLNLCFIFSIVGLFLLYPYGITLRPATLLQVIYAPPQIERRTAVRNNTETKQKFPVVFFHLYMHKPSPLLSIFHALYCTAAPTVVPMLPKDTFRLSMQPNIGYTQHQPLTYLPHQHLSSHKVLHPFSIITWLKSKPSQPFLVYSTRQLPFNCNSSTH